MGNSRARGSRTSRSSAKPPRKADGRTTTPSRDGRVDAKFTFVTKATEGESVPDELDGLEAMGAADGTFGSGAGDVIDAAEAAVEEAALEEKYGESGSDSDDGSATPREPGETDEKDA